MGSKYIMLLEMPTARSLYNHGLMGIHMQVVYAEVTKQFTSICYRLQPLFAVLGIVKKAAGLESLLTLPIENEA